MNEELSPCPYCGGELYVREDLLVVCLDCEEHIGWYIANSGAVKLMNWRTHNVKNRRK